MSFLNVVIMIQLRCGCIFSFLWLVVNVQPEKVVHLFIDTKTKIKVQNVLLLYKIKQSSGYYLQQGKTSIHMNKKLSCLLTKLTVTQIKIYSQLIGGSGRKRECSVNACLTKGYIMHIEICNIKLKIWEKLK